MNSKVLTIFISVILLMSVCSSFAFAASEVWTLDDFEPGVPVFVDGVMYNRNLDGTYDEGIAALLGTPKNSAWESEVELGDESASILLPCAFAAIAVVGASITHRKRIHSN